MTKKTSRITPASKIKVVPKQKRTLGEWTKLRQLSTIKEQKKKLWYPLPTNQGSPPKGYKLVPDRSYPTPPQAKKFHSSSSKSMKSKANGQSWLKSNIIDKQGVMLTTGKDVHHAIQRQNCICFYHQVYI